MSERKRGAMVHIFGPRKGPGSIYFQPAKGRSGIQMRKEPCFQRIQQKITKNLVGM